MFEDGVQTYTLSAAGSPPVVEKMAERINFQVWLAGDFADRYIEVLRRAKQRQPRAHSGHVNRRLLGIEPDTDGLVTDADVAYFRHGTQANQTLPHGIQHAAADESPPPRTIKVRRIVAARRTPEKKNATHKK